MLKLQIAIVADSSQLDQHNCWSSLRCFKAAAEGQHHENFEAPFRVVSDLTATKQQKHF